MTAAAAAGLVLLAACAAPASPSTAVPVRPSAKLDLVCPDTFGPIENLSVSVSRLDGGGVRGGTIDVSPGVHEIGVMIVWTASPGAKTVMFEGVLSGRLEDGGRYRLRATRTAKDRVCIELIDDRDGDRMASLETALTAGGA